MGLTKRIMDVELIIKKINDNLSTEEEEFFKEWLSEKKEHQHFFDKAKDYFLNGSYFDQNALDNELAWSELKDSLTPKSKTKSGKIIKLFASIAASILLVTGVAYIYNSIDNDLETNTIADKVITPGTSKATLILEDGSRHDLSQGAKVELTSGGANIRSEGKKIEYSNESDALTEVAYNSLIIPKGGEFFIELSDGTKVWLNSETTFKYPTSFAGNQRKVEITGEAYFEVAKNEDKPFQVSTGNHVIEVLGTQFNLSSYNDDSHIYTTLVEGKVNVFDYDNPDNGQILSPNDQSIMNKQTGEISKIKVNPSHYTSWKSGSFFFQDKSLEEIFKILSRWYDIDVFYDNDLIRNETFTGGFKKYEEFDKVRQLIEKTNEVNIEIKNKAVIIR